MGMGIPLPMGISRESHRHGKGWQVSDGNWKGNGSGITGMRMSLFA